MMDGSSIFPSGFHPSSQNSLPDLRGDAIPIRRSDAKNIKYFFIDFSLASFSEDGKEPRRVVGRVGEDTLAPELSDDVPYDPFPVDVYILGDVIRKTFLEVYILFRHFDNILQPRKLTKYQRNTLTSRSSGLWLRRWCYVTRMAVHRPQRPWTSLAPFCLRGTQVMIGAWPGTMNTPLQGLFLMPNSYFGRQQ